ncbi:MAG: VOC family protein, partial [Acidobacteriota bacterium]|nr:VOC family protein [Acidobacteriota bacterium]
LDRSGHLTYRNPGINHIGFVVEDIEALTSRLSEAGFKENMRDDSHPSRKRTYYYDADGNEYEFVEYTTQNSEERNQY